jgi:ABC-type bacteriocin/lantibiotic exporter with double-glycine peptidase domain
MVAPGIIRKSLSIISSEEIMDILEPEIPRTGFMRVMSYYEPKITGFFSIVTAVIASAVFPLFGYIFSNLLFVIMIGDRNPDFIQDSRTWVLGFLYLAVGSGTLGCIQKLLFFITGENLTFRVRSMLFESLLHK